MTASDVALRADFEALAGLGRDPAGGWSRPGWSLQEQAAHDWFADRARAAGLSVRQDAFGNTIARREGSEDLPAIAMGSHLDTVRNGGLYDGALGVLVALEAARRIAPGPRPLEVIAFRDEEGRFGPFTGSRAMTGELDEAGLERLRDGEGILLADAMAAVGYRPDGPRAAARDLSGIAAWLEVHIEQGPVLEAAGLPLGVVTAIAGQRRLSLRFTGVAGHAGTVPMDTRRDAFQAAARFAVAFDEMIHSEGEGARGTIGIVRITPNQGNVVPGEARLSLEIRDADNGRLDRLAGRVAALADDAAVATGTSVSIKEAYASAPVAMSATLIAAFEAAAVDCGHASRRLLSGANHDAGVLGRRLPAGMLFVPSRGGVSHAPDEHTDWPPIAAAAEVLSHAAANLLQSRAIRD